MSDDWHSGKSKQTKVTGLLFSENRSPLVLAHSVTVKTHSHSHSPCNCPSSVSVNLPLGARYAALW